MSSVPIVAWRGPSSVPIVAWRGPSGLPGPPGLSGLFSFSSVNGQGFTVQIGQPVKYNYYLAQGDSISNMAVAVSNSVTGSGQIGTSVVSGPIIRSDWTQVTGTALLTPGAKYFLTTNVHGSLTNIPPVSTGAGTINQMIGWALNETTLVVDISRPIIL